MVTPNTAEHTATTLRQVAMGWGGADESLVANVSGDRTERNVPPATHGDVAASRVRMAADARTAAAEPRQLPPNLSTRGRMAEM